VDDATIYRKMEMEKNNKLIVYDNLKFGHFEFYELKKFAIFLSKICDEYFIKDIYEIITLYFSDKRVLIDSHSRDHCPSCDSHYENQNLDCMSYRSPNCSNCGLWSCKPCCEAYSGNWECFVCKLI
jgi:hypothetical protein